MTKFREVFGNSPQIKIIEFLLEGWEIDFPITTIHEMTNVSRVTISKILNDLLKKRIVKHTRNLGSSKMYKLNSDDKRVKLMSKMFVEIIVN